MELFDTHCHVHEAVKRLTPVHDKWVKLGHKPADIVADAKAAGVQNMVCVGTTLADSQLAIDFVQDKPGLVASIGVHPHEAKDHLDEESFAAFRELGSSPKVVAVGECGLDYFYNHSSKVDQMALLRLQLDVAKDHNLPLIFHVRDAFEDFWPIFDTYEGLRGVIHSFTATEKELAQILERGLFVGLNGITTFTKQEEQIAAIKAVPLENLLLETDAPFLTPAPYRGTICEPKHVRVTAEFLSQLRNETLEEIATTTTHNAKQLFGVA